MSQLTAAEKHEIHMNRIGVVVFTVLAILNIIFALVLHTLEVNDLLKGASGTINIAFYSVIFIAPAVFLQFANFEVRREAKKKE